MRSSWWMIRGCGKALLQLSGTRNYSRACTAMGRHWLFIGRSQPIRNPTFVRRRFLAQPKCCVRWDSRTTHCRLSTLYFAIQNGVFVRNFERRNSILINPTLETRAVCWKKPSRQRLPKKKNDIFCEGGLSSHSNDRTERLELSIRF